MPRGLSVLTMGAQFPSQIWNVLPGKSLNQSDFETVSLSSKYQVRRESGLGAQTKTQLTEDFKSEPKIVAAARR